jgi:hypothetical protein
MSESAAFGPFNAAVDQLLDLLREVMREELAASQEQSGSSGWMNLKTAASFRSNVLRGRTSSVRVVIVTTPSALSFYHVAATAG